MKIALSILFISFTFLAWAQKEDTVFYSSLKVITFHKKKNNRIPFATVKIFGTNNLSKEVRANKRGEAFIDSLESGHNYTFEVSKEKFLGNKGQVSTKNLKDSKEFQSYVELINSVKVTKFPTLVFEKKNPNLIQNTKDSLEYLSSIFTENPTIVFNVILSRFRDEDESIIDQRKEAIRDYFIVKGIHLKRIGFSVEEKYSKGKKKRVVGNIEVVSWDFAINKGPEKQNNYQVQLRFFNKKTKELITDSLKVHWITACPNKIEYTNTGVLELVVSDHKEKIRAQIECESYESKEILIEFTRNQTFKILDVYLKPKKE